MISTSPAAHKFIMLLTSLLLYNICRTFFIQEAWNSSRFSNCVIQHKASSGQNAHFSKTANAAAYH